jgi:hypothetical protein
MSASYRARVFPNSVTRSSASTRMKARSPISMAAASRYSSQVSRKSSRPTPRRGGSPSPATSHLPYRRPTPFLLPSARPAAAATATPISASYSVRPRKLREQCRAIPSSSQNRRCLSVRDAKWKTSSASSGRMQNSMSPPIPNSSGKAQICRQRVSRDQDHFHQ